VEAGQLSIRVTDDDPLGGDLSQLRPHEAAAVPQLLRKRLEKQPGALHLRLGLFLAVRVADDVGARAVEQVPHTDRDGDPGESELSCFEDQELARVVVGVLAETHDPVDDVGLPVPIVVATLSKTYPSGGNILKENSSPSVGSSPFISARRYLGSVCAATATSSSRMTSACSR